MIGVYTKSVKFLRKLPAYSRTVAMSTSCGEHTPSYKYETLVITQPREFIWQVMLNRPEKLNAMNLQFMIDLKECVDSLATEETCRAVVLSAAGRLFTAGLDVTTLMQLGQRIDASDVGRRAFKLRDFIRLFQETFNALELCPKPVIVAIHNACIGGGIDMISACDIRYASKDAFFQVKEVDVGLAADLGTLQRLPKVVGSDSLSRELVYTARKLHADEAKEFGFINKIYEDKEATVQGALETAALIASKSPLAVQGSKIAMVYARDHSVADGLNQIATWNQSMVQSEDVVKAAQGFVEKSLPIFAKL